MKSIKRLTGMLLVFCLAVSCIALPASAVSQYYTSARACIEQGPYIYRNVSGRTGYVFVLQSYLWRFSQECRDQLKYGNQSIDGEYGGRTYNAVKVCQQGLGLRGADVDGEVGSKTWGKIGGSLYYKYGESDCHILLYRANGLGTALSVVKAGDNLPYLCYLTQSGTEIITLNVDGYA